MYPTMTLCNGLCGCECDDCQQGGGLGLFEELIDDPGFSVGDGISAAAAADPEPFSKIALTVASAFIKAWDTIEQWFGIGTGRREADVIVPVQNAIGERLAEIVAAYPRANVAQLQAFYTELSSIKFEFDNFVHDAKFTDGRASAQALATINPLLDDNIQKIANRIYQLGGIIPSPQLTQNYGHFLPTLQYQTQQYPWLPQAGTIPPNAPLSPIVPERVQSVNASLGSILPVVLVGGLAWAVFSRSGK